MQEKFQSRGLTRRRNGAKRIPILRFLATLRLLHFALIAIFGFAESWQRLKRNLSISASSKVIKASYFACCFLDFCRYSLVGAVKERGRSREFFEYFKGLTLPCS